jgi:Uma2 family endonuclease
MTRQEFHAAYANYEGLARVELIEGVVYLPSPISLAGHARPQSLVLFWLNAFAAAQPAVEAVGPASVLLDDQNEPEPDAMLLRTTPGWLNEEGFLVKIPELAVEIANSSRSRDLHQKLRAYERNGIAEYVVWRVSDGEIDWFELREGRYVKRAADASGMIESREFPGLVMDVPAMLAMDRAKVLAALKA